MSAYASSDSSVQISSQQETLHANAGGKYLTFHLGGEEYGLAILKVQEIIGIMAITRVPRTPDYIRGVINLRGKVISVVDLRRKFEMEIQLDTERTCIIVVQMVQNGAQVTMGLLVDEVSEVLNVDGEKIEPPPTFGTTVEADFIFGMGKIGQKVIMLLDVEKVLATSTIDRFEEELGTG